jgi:hypothetical protein
MNAVIDDCAFVDRFGNEVRASSAAYQEIRWLRERFEEIEYHVSQLGTRIAQHTASEKDLATARHHADKIAALAKARVNGPVRGAEKSA